MIKALKLILYFLAGIFAMALLYFAGAGVGMIIPVNSAPLPGKGDVEIFIETNGLHADIVMPVSNDIFDWGEFLPLSAEATREPGHVSIGWGEKNFYILTPTMADLTFPTLMKALFVPSATAMHVEYLLRSPQPSEDSRRIIITGEMYEKLVNDIRKSFVLDNESPLLIPEAGYHQYDNFYEAHGKYHMFWTCNNWTNTRLKEIGIKNSLWTPMDWGVFYYLE